MSGLYTCIEDDVLALFNVGWTHPDVPVYWRTNDLEVIPDPFIIPFFLRNTVIFGPEAYIAFGGGRGANDKTIDGVVEIVGFASRSKASERNLLDLLWDGTQTFRSKRVVGSFPGGSDLSFIGDGSTFNIDPEESGNWYMRGTRVAFTYRFVA